MSVRAYKIKEIKIEDDPSFNLWYDHELIKYLPYDQLDEDGCGTMTMSVSLLKEILEDSKINSDVRKNIENDIKNLLDNDDVQYLCG